MVDSLPVEPGRREWRPAAPALGQHTPELLGICGVSCKFGAHANDSNGLDCPAILDGVANASHLVFVESQTDGFKGEAFASKESVVKHGMEFQELRWTCTGPLQSGDVGHRSLRTRGLASCMGPR